MAGGGAGEGENCEIVANAGNPVTCTAATPIPIPAGYYFSIFLFNFTNPSDFANARVTVSFTCQ
jgi:hypothetical protein